MKIPGSELALARSGGARTHADRFHRRDQGRLRHHHQNVRDKVDIKLSDATAAELAKRPIEYDTGFTLLPGKYTIKFLARDAETGRIGTYQTTFVDPEPEQGREADSDQLRGAEQPARGSEGRAVQRGRRTKTRPRAVNPLVQDGQKLIPSVTRVFSKSTRHVRLPAGLRARRDDDAAAGRIRDLLSADRRRRSKRRRCRSPKGSDPKSKTVPLRFNLLAGVNFSRASTTAR